MKTIGFTRPSIRLKDSIAEAESLGFKVLAAPSLEISHGDKEEFSKAKEMLISGKTDIAVFGSSTSVEECMREYGDEFPSILGKTIIVSIGPSTSESLRKAGIMPDMMPEDYSSYGIVDMLKNSVKEKNIILIRSDRGSPVIRTGLTEAGAHVTDVAAYRLTPHSGSDDLSTIMDAIEDGTLDAMCFTSPLSATSFFNTMTDRFGESRSMDLMGRILVAAIGRPTAETLKGLGWEPDVVPENTTFRDMLLAVRDHPDAS